MRYKILVSLILFCIIPLGIKAQEAPVGVFHFSDEMLKSTDSDLDGLSDYQEINVFKTNSNLADTDEDGYVDGLEISNGYDPNKNSDDKLAKSISVSLAEQSLTYFLGTYELNKIKISSGVAKMPTPKGEFTILKKSPSVTYGVKGGEYFYPNTKWNMLFKYQKKGNLYIHGAYWHNNFGQPMSHGCINVSYEDIESLYNWADLGTKIVIN